MNTHDIIAFQGDVELEKAVWDTDWGMYAVFKLDQKPQDKNNANPFKRFTKMRKGKVGTRFDAVFVAEDKHDEAVYEDEVMLKGWSDGTSGWKVTLWLHGTDAAIETHPFMEFEKGDEFALVLIELDEDETPINQVKRERLSRAEARKKYPLAMLAGQLCKSPAFQEWLSHDEWCKQQRRENGSGWDDIAARWMYRALGIESRREIDQDEDIAHKFHEHLRKPFLQWQAER